MKKYISISYKRVVELALKVAFASAFFCLLSISFMGFNTSISISVLLGNIVVSLYDYRFDKYGNAEVEEGSPKEVVLVLSVFLLCIYFGFLADFSSEAKPEKENTLTEKERERVGLKIKCRDAGYSYAASTEDLSRRDMVIPRECRGHPSTNKGIQLYYSR